MNTSGLVQRLGGRLLGAARATNNVLAAGGLLAVMFLLMNAGERFVREAVEAPSPALFTLPQAALAAEPEAAPKNPAHQALASFLSRRYRVAQAATEQLVGVAFDVGRKVGLDPLLILAVMAVESRLNPIAESEFGAKGLMQVIPKYHRARLAAMGGDHAVLDPLINVTLGASILKDYIRRTGSIESGLQFYNGSPTDETSEYAEKVIAEQERLKQAIHRVERSAPRNSSA